MEEIEEAIRHLPGDDYCSAIQQFILPRSQFSNEMFEIIGYQTIREIFAIPGSSQEYKKTKARFLRREFIIRIIIIIINNNKDNHNRW